MDTLSDTLNARLSYLYSLSDGWADCGQGKEIDRIALQATIMLLNYSSRSLPEPNLIPMEEGSIGVEWTDLINMLIINVHADHFDFHNYDQNGDVIHSLGFRFNEIEKMMDLIQKK